MYAFNQFINKYTVKSKWKTSSSERFIHDKTIVLCCKIRWIEKLEEKGVEGKGMEMGRREFLIIQICKKKIAHDHPKCHSLCKFSSA